MAAQDYQTGLDRTAANHQPLTPLLFLERAAATFPDHVAVVHGALRRPYRELRDRCVRLASALAARGIGRAIRWRRCCRTSPRCWSAITACRWPARC